MTTDGHRIAALKQFRQLELASLAEAVTLLVLVFLAVPLKHFGGWELGVRVMGPLHGFAFVAYLWNVWQANTLVRWRRTEVLRMTLAAFVPLGGFLNWPWLVRRTRRRAAGLETA